MNRCLLTILALLVLAPAAVPARVVSGPASVSVPGSGTAFVYVIRSQVLTQAEDAFADAYGYEANVLCTAALVASGDCTQAQADAGDIVPNPVSKAQFMDQAIQRFIQNIVRVEETKRALEIEQQNQNAKPDISIE